MNAGRKTCGTFSDPLLCDEADQVEDTDVMASILDEVQQLFRERMRRLDRMPSGVAHLQEKNKLLKTWLGELSQQNVILMDTVKELEYEAVQRCDMLESRIITENCGNCSRQQRMAESSIHEIREKQHYLEEKHRETLSLILREKQDLQESLDIKSSKLEWYVSEVDRLRAELTSHTTSSDITGAAATNHNKPGVTLTVESTSRLLQRCRTLVEERDQAVNQLAMHLQRQTPEHNQLPDCHKAIQVTPTETKSAPEEVRQPESHLNDTEMDTKPQSTTVKRQNSTQDHLSKQIEESQQLIADLQQHLASSRNEVVLKDSTLARLETKLDTTRSQLTESERLRSLVEQELAVARADNETLQEQMAVLQREVQHEVGVRCRLESEADLQLAQIADLQERLLLAQTDNKQLTDSCIEKDMEIGRQWSTINTLKMSVMQSKSQLEHLQQGQTLLGTLMGHGAVRAANNRNVHNV